MKTLSSVISCIVFFFSSNAHASLVTYSFTGEVFSIYETEYDPAYTRTSVESSVLSGHLISKKQKVSGTFSYDTNTPLASQQADVPPTIGSLLLYGPVKSLTLNFHESQLSYVSNSALDGYIMIANDVTNYGYVDWFEAYHHSVNENGHSEQLALHFHDYTGNALNSGGIPDLLTLPMFQDAAVYYTWTGFDKSWKSMTAGAKFETLTMLSNESEVPEPTAFLLMVIGATGMLIVRRRDRSPL